MTIERELEIIREANERSISDADAYRELLLQRCDTIQRLVRDFCELLEYLRLKR